MIPPHPLCCADKCWQRILFDLAPTNGVEVSDWPMFVPTAGVVVRTVSSPGPLANLDATIRIVAYIHHNAFRIPFTMNYSVPGHTALTPIFWLSSRHKRKVCPLSDPSIIVDHYGVPAHAKYRPKNRAAFERILPG